MEQNPPSRGTKRKRYEPPKEDIATKVAGKLHHDVKEVRKAAKKAKTFETQKLVKRLKTLRKKDESASEIADLESQLAVLKNLSHEVIGNTAFKTKINKDKTLLRNDHVQRAVSNELQDLLKLAAEPGTPTAKIQGRLLSSKTLALVVGEAVSDLRNVIEPKPKKGENENEEGEGDEIDEEDDEGAPSSSPSKPPPSKKAKKESKPHLEDGSGTDEEEAIDAGWESGTVYSEDEDEDSQDGWESGSVHSVKGKEIDSGGDNEEESSDDDEGDDENAHAASSDSNDSDEDGDGDDGGSGDAQQKKKSASGAGTTKSSKSNKEVFAPKSQSTFLPSLSVGFVRGDSDSEWSESEAKVADLGARKNRRGQRARQAIWEKKYGKNANHKKKEQTEREKAKAAWLAKRGTRPDNPKNGQRYNSKQRHETFRNKEKPAQHRQPPDSGWAPRNTTVKNNVERLSASGNSHATAERTLHPSWEAKRKLKEKESAGIIPSQGKKIKFS